MAKGILSPISLPTGGGALRGLGEKFSPDLHTGTAHFAIPIDLPRGRHDFAPALTLSYGSAGGNGPFGMGWSIGVSSIARQVAKGIPRYDDALDTFVIGGAEDLVRVEDAFFGQPNVARYRPRSETLFAQILHHTGPNTSYWEVRNRDGSVSVYGRAAAGGDAPVVADPASPRKIAVWHVCETRDVFGNRIEYEYTRDRGDDGVHTWDQLYVKQIRYADFGDRNAPDFLVSIDFTYEDRPDQFSSYRSGFEVRTRKRCSEIVVTSHAGQARRLHAYRLGYVDQHASAPVNAVSLLDRVQHVGFDEADNPVVERPPLEYGYTTFDPTRREFAEVTGRDGLPGSLSRPDCELLDLFGSGLSDLLEWNGTVRYWRNLGGGQFDVARLMDDAPAGVTLVDRGVQFIDANGDGRTDLLVTHEGVGGYFPMAVDGLWSDRSFQSYRVAPSFDLKDSEVKLVDLDGDGVTDAIRSGTRLECFFNDRDAGWIDTLSVERRPLDVFPNVNFSDPRVRWADMTGDGLQDIALVGDGNVEYWPSLGRGRWAPRIHMRNSPRLPFDYNPKRLLLGDVDGDGAADLMYVDDERVTLWINRCGNEWSDPIVIEGTPPVVDTDGVRLVDLLGNGVGGILWSGDPLAAPGTRMYFLDFTGGIKPYLLQSIDSHLGAVTRIAYSSSTRFYLEDQKHHATRWKTSLPFPVQVIARTEVIDEISGNKLTSEFSYHHGHWDGAEREFRGFGRVDEVDTQTFESYHRRGLHGPDVAFEPIEPAHFTPPTLQKTWFHVGPVGPEHGDWRELDYSAEFWSGDPQVCPRSPSMIAYLDGLSRRERRDAVRALHASPLRTELYSLDGSAREARPYTVTESQYEVCGLVDGAGTPTLSCDATAAALSQADARVFFPHVVAQRKTQWERGDDPMTSFTVFGTYDADGLPGSKIEIAVPRGRRPLVPIAAGDPAPEPYLATHTRSEYARRSDAAKHLSAYPTRTTVFEIVNDGRDEIFTLIDRVARETLDLTDRVVSQTLNYYDGPAFQGLPLGQLGDHGALVRCETLVLTEHRLAEGYRSGAAVASPPEIPPYLKPGGATPWTSEYPAGFRASLPPMAGYVFHPGSADPLDLRGYFSTTFRRQYDFHVAPPGRGLVVAGRDALGHEMSIEYDTHEFFPTVVVDGAGLKTEATYSFRSFHASTVVDPNGNETRYTYTPSAMLETVFVRGKAGEGDAALPSTQYEYDWFAFVTARAPASVRTIHRLHHDTELDVPAAERSATSTTVEFSDGFGRTVQTRTEAESTVFGGAVFADAVLPADQSDAAGTAADVVGASNTSGAAPNVLVSGWQIYDNRGHVVAKYEPFFSTGWEYSAPTAAQNRARIEKYYDALGNAVRIVQPDGSEYLSVRGVPGTIAAVALDDPSHYEPTPWETYAYDPADNGGRTHPIASLDFKSHWNTPSSTRLDAMGRTIESVQRTGPSPATDWFVTRSTVDTQGRVTTMTDALGRVVLEQVFDLAGQPLRIQSLDEGVQRRVWDAKGNRLEQRDARGALTLHATDSLNRPTQVWARDDAGSAVTLRERITYGDTGLASQSAAERGAHLAANRFGKLYQHHDEAGLLTCETFDFKGNILEKTRRVVADSALLSLVHAPYSVPASAFQIDWNAAGGVPLDDTVYRTTIAYDALNRVKHLRFPASADGARHEMRPRYNAAGALESVALDGEPYVERIAYTAKGQRALIAYGNGLLTRAAYDPTTFRIARLRTEKFATVGAATYHPAGSVVQDESYVHDLMGNLVKTTERVGGCGVDGTPLGRDASDRDFTYDPLYRLLSATGRECKDIPQPRAWSDEPRCGFNSGQHGTPTQANAPMLCARYSEQYEYDATGNLLLMRHVRGASAWNRRFGVGGQSPSAWAAAWNAHLNAGPWANPPSNQTTNVGDDDPASTATHRYDVTGNLIQELSSRFFEWNHNGQLRSSRTQTGNAEPSLYVWCLYDGSGQRVKKLARRQGGRYEVTTYVDGLFEHCRQVAPGVSRENTLLQISDHKSVVAQRRIGAAFPDDPAPAVQYFLENYQRSSHLVVDDTGNWINREELFPHGDTSFGSFGRKRYRFTGKERDEETGLYYHGARYYASWLGRWASCDPNGYVDGANLYLYANANPISRVDPDGRTGTNAQGPFYPNKPDPNWTRPKFTGGIGDEAHRDVLFHLTLRMMVAGYDVTWETPTLIGGSRRGGSRGEIDLVIRRKESGVTIGHVYDLKPRDSGRKYQKFMDKYVKFGEKLLRPNQPLFYKEGTVLETAPAWILGAPIVTDKGHFFRVYWTWLPRDKATGQVIPGYIEYTYRDYYKNGKPVPVEVPETKKKKAAVAVAAPKPALDPAPVPVPALASTRANNPSGLTDEQRAQLEAHDRPLESDTKGLDIALRVVAAIAIAAAAVFGGGLKAGAGGSLQPSPQPGGFILHGEHHDGA